ncbi:MAG: bifunctional phosphopantothenoylcysteine decarboxylase/phosphopantothenate--cysteine ligase CoaBC [Anaerolinea sp.]|nr:bifunctional phosphopantothenoylcysteine decarboxylase/phosphopantothenate--cysteine ligase CoaBC [Anaerolinea sp.]
MNIFNAKTILLGITGSIAAYKGVELASRLAQAGALVDVILTPAAEKFVTPLTFQSVTGRKAYTDADLWGGEGHVAHIGLGRGGELLIIAPASANTIARLANGIAENLLCVTALAAHCPLIIAPAMDAGMFSHPATRKNVETLIERGALLIGPVEGHLASGLVGVGRMEDTPIIMGAVRWMLGREGKLAGRKVIVTAGGTQEAIDPVRTITNYSSGKQGFAVAQAAIDQGADVVLITTASLPEPFGCRVVRVASASDMLQAVQAEVKDADGLIMAAAVADFKPVQAASGKIKKDAGFASITLEPTVDILKEVSHQRDGLKRLKFVIGFAAESEDLLENARIKLNQKKLDMIVANDISAADAGFEADTNRVILIHKDGSAESMPLMTKVEVAEIIITRAANLIE